MRSPAFPECSGSQSLCPVYRQLPFQLVGLWGQQISQVTAMDKMLTGLQGHCNVSWAASCSLCSHKGAGMAVGALRLPDPCGARGLTAWLFPSLRPVSLGLLHSVCDQCRIRSFQLGDITQERVNFWSQPQWGRECLGRRNCWHECLLSQ